MKNDNDRNVYQISLIMLNLKNDINIYICIFRALYIISNKHF